MHRILTLCLLLFIAPLGVAAERILDFDSQITVFSSGEISVTETITVRSEGKQIRRGIYRDFPTDYKDRYGNKVKVKFEVVSVERDNRNEPWHSEWRSNGTRIYIGSKNVFIPNGEHQYRITYRTDRQLGFFDGHDELYWNVTGNGWDFFIDHASATVNLPDGIDPDTITLDAYTGPYGAKGHRADIWLDSDGTPRVETTAPLRPNEGLTIAVGWPPGFIERPDTVTQLGWMLEDNLAYIIAGIGTLLVALFYLVAWWRVGVDPMRGTIIPHFNPPKNLSPAAMRYLMRMGFDNKTLSAAVIDMAVKGYLEITDNDDDYSLLKSRDADIKKLSPGEKALAKKLFSDSTVIELENKNHKEIKAAIDNLKKHLKGEYNTAYFKTNIGVIGIGAVLSIITVLGSGVFAASEPAPFLFICLWLTIWSSAVTALWLGRQIFMAVVFGLFELVGLAILGTIAGPWIVALVGVLIGLNILFAILMKAPTRRGRKLMDAIEGFRMYLKTAEEERLNVLHPPERTPELFEKYLPYALALDVDQEWTEKFSDVLAKATTGNDHYSPSWYHGRHWSSHGARDFGSALGSSLGSAISSSSSAPGSSSGGGGGGFSGGGGGGGGGGGW